MITRHENGSFELWLQVVREIIAKPTDQLMLLDLCCNECTVTAQLPWLRHVGVDVVECPKRPESVTFTKMDVLDFLDTMPDKVSDVSICSDGIEHLVGDEGVELLIEMERVARLSIVFTPIGPYIPNVNSTNPDDHKSEWIPEDLQLLGWKTVSFPKWHPKMNLGAFFAWKGSL